MSITNATELIASFKVWQDDATFSDAQIDEFIQLQEAEFNRRLRSIDMEVRATASLTNSYLLLPTDFLELRSIHIEGDPDQRIEQVTPKRLRDMDTSGQVGVPKVVAIADGQFVFSPPTDGTRTIEIIYYGKILTLLSNSTNWVLDSHPDLYLWGILRAADIFEANDERAGSFTAFIEDRYSEIQENSDKQRYGSGPLIQRPAVVA